MLLQSVAPLSISMASRSEVVLRIWAVSRRPLAARLQTLPLGRRGWGRQIGLHEQGRRARFIQFFCDRLSLVLLSSGDHKACDMMSGKQACNGLAQSLRSTRDNRDFSGKRVHTIETCRLRYHRPASFKHWRRWLMPSVA